MECQICFQEGDTFGACKQCDKQTCGHCLGTWACVQLQSYKTNEVRCAFCKSLQDPTEILKEAISFKSEIMEHLCKNALFQMTDVSNCPRCGLAAWGNEPRVSCSNCDMKFDTIVRQSLCKKLLRLIPGIRLFFQSISSLDWVRDNCKPCPRCKVPIFKDGGCNHVHCTVCGVNFCWKCGQDFLNHSRWCTVWSMRPLFAIFIPFFIFFASTWTLSEPAGSLLRSVLKSIIALLFYGMANVIVIQWFSEDVWRYFAAPAKGKKEALNSLLHSGTAVVVFYAALTQIWIGIANVWAACVAVICFAEYRDTPLDDRTS